VKAGDQQQLREAVEARLRELEAEDVIRRIWAGDHTVWKPHPAEIADRLGWLRLPQTMRKALPQLRALAEDCASFQRVVWLGMGGSSLAAEVLAKMLGGRELTVLDSTHPEAVAAVDTAGDPASTLFVVASKSGTTIETLSHFAYFWDKRPDGGNFIAITDAGSPLEALAEEHSFRHICRAPKDVGGRYSALSHFGLVAAALLGADPATLLDTAAGLTPALQTPAESNPGARLGVTIGEAALAGRDKLTLLADAAREPFGDWVEQLIAESTGKESNGIVPVVGEPPGPPIVYGNDRLFIRLGEVPGPDPAIESPLSAESMGADFLRWEFAIAVAGRVLGINPFDQPDVESAKIAARQALMGETAAPSTPPAAQTLASLQPGDYLALQAYLPPTPQNRSRLQAVRLRLRDRFRVATTLGFGPRFLHSTGQLYKGGPNSGVFLQVVDQPGLDLPVPGTAYSFRRLIDAQSAGDLAALLARGRRVSRLSLDALEAL